MKKIVLFILVGLMTGTLFAQEPGAAEKNAANDALRKKDYASAFTNLEKYLQINEYKDKAAIYNAAFAANKSKNYTAAEKYFDMSIKNNYKLGSSYLGKAQAEEDLKKESDMLSTLEAGLKAVPGNAKLENKYGTYFMKKGQEAQKSNKLEEAVKNYTKVSALTTKAQKVQALTALAQLYYNDGAGILQKANSFANSDKEKYAAEEKKAQTAFKKAEEYVGQLQATDAENPIAKELAKQIKSVLK